MKHNRLIACLFIMGAIGACDKSQPEAAPNQVEVDKVKEDPSRYYGKQVTLSGDVETVYGPQAFMLEGKGLHWGDNVYVLTKSPLKLGGATLKEDEELIVHGTVQPFVKVELERDLGWTFDEALELKLREQPVVIASNITRVDRYAQWSAEKPEGVLVGFYSVTVAPDPAALVGQAITLDSIPVRASTSKGAWVGYGTNRELFVIPEKADQTALLQQGKRVHVSGTLQAAPNEEKVKKEWQLSRDDLAKVQEGTLYIAASEVSAASAEPTAQRVEE